MNELNEYIAVPSYLRRRLFQGRSRQMPRLPSIMHAFLSCELSVTETATLQKAWMNAEEMSYSTKPKSGC